MNRIILLTITFLISIFSSPLLYAGSSPMAYFLTPDTTLCGSGLVHFVNNSTNAVKYIWYFGDGQTDTVFNPIHRYNSSGLYKVKLVVSDGLFEDSMVRKDYIKVAVIPTIFIYTSDTNLCINSFDTLRGSGAAVYTWQPSNITAPILVVSPTTLTQYKVVGKSIEGCTDSTTINIHVMALPNIKISPVYISICIGDSATLSASGGVKYAWNPSISSISSIIKLSPVVLTTYQVKGTDNNGCSDTASATVSIYSLPSVAIVSARTSICTGSFDTLTATGAINYTWSQGGSTAKQLFINPTINTKYILYGSDINGCKNIDSVIIKVDTLPRVTVGGSKTMCNGSVVTIGSKPVKGYKYLWSPLTNVFNSNMSRTGVSPAYTQEYTLTVTNTSTGCSNWDSVNVKVDSLPKFVFWDTFVCPNKPIALGPAPKKGYSYSWTPATGLSSTIIGNPIATVSTSTAFTLVMTDSLTGCYITDSSRIGIYNVDSIGIISGLTKVHKGDTVGYKISVVPGFVYQWVVTGATIINGQGTDTITVLWNSAAIDSIKVWTTSTCSDTSKFYVNKPTHIVSSYIINPKFLLYPNPTNDILYVMLNQYKDFEYNVDIIDMSGRLLQHINQNAIKKVWGIKTTMLSAGVYFIRITLNDGRVLTEKFNVFR